MARAHLACAFAVALALVAATGACRSGITTPRAPAGGAGLTISVYQHGVRSYSVVDDRRWVEVADGVVVLDHIDPLVALPSLVIEPIGSSAAGALVIEQCARDALPELAPRAVSSLVCKVTGRGRHLVRMLYVSSSLGYTARHELTLEAGDRATIATRFAIVTPAWGMRADLIVHEGMLGTGEAPIELARGSLVLDGSTAILAATPRVLPARMRRVYDGALRAGISDETDALWARDSVQAVWVWLELPTVWLAAGPVHAHVALPGEAIREIVVPAAGRDVRGDVTRLPLWIDDELRGLRQRQVFGSDGAGLVDRFAYSVANTGDAPREVWIEEHLRPARRRTVHATWPGKPEMTRELARTRLVIAPGGIERVRYAIAYAF